MAWIIKTCRLLPVLIICALPAFYGCEDSHPRDQVDDTVKELSGAKNVERMNQMKKDIEVIEGHQEDQMKQLEESVEE